MTGTSQKYPVVNLVFVRLGKYRNSQQSQTFVSLGTSNWVNNVIPENYFLYSEHASYVVRKLKLNSKFFFNSKVIKFTSWLTFLSTYILLFQGCHIWWEQICYVPTCTASSLIFDFITRWWTHFGTLKIPLQKKT